MSRQSFGDWGAGLTDGEFARALAALGVAVRRQSLPWPADLDLEARLADWTANAPPAARVVSWSAPTPAECAAVPAARCAGAWSGNWIQLEIREPGSLDPTWLATTLAHSDVDVGAVYLRADRAGVPLTWRWPLRIAIGPAQARAVFEQALAGTTQSVGWWDTLTRIDGLDRNRNVCDLLVLPVDLQEALTALEVQRAPVLAGSVVVLGGPGDLGWQRAGAALERLSAASGALGAALLNVASSDRSEWLVSVVNELSHDRPLPVALRMSTPAGEPVLLLADRRVAEKTRVSERVVQVAERLQAAAETHRAEEREARLEVPFERHPSRPRDPSEPMDRTEAGGAGGWSELPGLDDWGGAVESADEAAAPESPDRSGDWSPAADRDASGGEASAEWEPPREPELSPPEAPAIAVPDGSATARNLGLTPQAYPAAEMAHRLAEAGRDLARYGNETGMASVAAEMAAAVAQYEAQNAARQARYILTRITDRSASDPEAELSRAFRAGAEHRINVLIGPRSEGGIAPKNLVAVPEELLPEDQEDYELTVVFSEPKLLAEPQSAPIVLPRKGVSSVASFHLQVPAECRRVDGRITVAYGNRVLQTALLRGPVAEHPDDSDGRIETEIEAVVRPGMAGLDSRRRFDAALVLNHDTDHVPGVTRLADDHVSFVTSNDLGREIEWFQNQLAQVAYDRSDFTGGLRSEATVDLLRSLARHGRQLYKHVVLDQLGDDPLVAAEFIQLVATSDEARLPAEFIYDRKAPTKDPPAPLCPNAEKALADGKCVAGCPAGAEEQSVICPLGFWGLKKVLERHAHDPALARRLRRAHGEYAIQSEPPESRAPLPVLRSGQLAASQVVDLGCPGGSQRVQQALARRLPAAGTAVTWKDWESGVLTLKPSLLLLLVHTDLVDAGDTMQKMEIGQASWLEVADLENGTYVAGADGPGPLVLLLGCETSAPQVSIHSFVSELRRQGAAIVVSALAKIHAEHAVPVAEEFIEQLAAIKGNGVGSAETFGEVMCRVRRSMLGQGQPMALCLSAYGDADWRLVPGPS